MKISLRRLANFLYLGFFTLIVIGACNAISNPKIDRIASTTNCHMIQHAVGETCVPNNPQRVVTLSMETLGNVLALDVKPIASANENPQEGEFYPYFPDDKVQGIKTVGDPAQPNVETILKLQPDLVFGWGGYEPEAIYPLLSKIAPTVLYHWQDDTWKDIFNFTAKVLGKQEVAQAAWERYEKRTQQLKIALGERYQDKTISVIYFYFGRIGSPVKNSFSGSILSDVGLQRPELQDIVVEHWGYIEYSEEKLVEKADGDVLFVISFTDDDKQFIERLEQKPLWNKLKAVQQNQVYFVNAKAWQGGNMTAVDTVLDDLFNYLVNAP